MLLPAPYSIESILHNFGCKDRNPIYFAWIYKPLLEERAFGATPEEVPFVSKF
jgi:hypothetical protein